MTTNISPLHSKFSSSDLASLKSSNNAYRKSTNLLNPSGATKSGTFLNYGTPQESNSYNPSYSTSPRQASLSGNSKKSPLKSLVIDTNEEISKYGNPQTHHFGSYTTTHGTSSSYNFSKNSLLSSLNGNLTTKFSRTNDPYKPSLLPATKSLSSGKLLLGSTNLGYPTTNQASKENTSPLMNTAPDSLSSGITPSHSHFKSGSSKFYPLEPSKLNTHEGIASDMKGSISSQNKPVYQSYQQENQPSNESKSASTAISQTESSASLSSSHNENITQAPKSSAQTPTTKKTPIPNHEPTKCSVKRNGIVKAYAANTNQGIVRNYNEDRVSIILNIMKPASRVNEDWPKCSFFGVYDGHGGVICADFLRDNLHQYVIKEPSFPWNPKEALMKGFDAAEKAFLEIAQGPNGEIDRSGSCAIVVLIIGDMCYVANVGDSRAVMSGDGGTKIFPLSRDHKPNDELEQKRIIEGGGKIYQTQAPALRQVTEGNTTKPQVQLLLGPHRVFPGRLSVSRTFGDIEAKLPRLGGNPNVVIPVPEIKAFKIAADHDFIVLASDGIYDKLSSRDVIKSVWESTHEQANNIHNQCGLGVENILREAIHRRTLDNITVVMICFKNFKYKLFPREKSKKTGEETLHRKETESSLARNILKPSNSTTHFSGRAVSQNHKERLNDQENHYEPASFSTFQKTHLGRKTPAPLSDGNIDQNVMDMKRYNLEKGESNFSDSSLLNKRTTPKRTGSSIANNENQKPESFHRYIHNTNMANFKSMDYKNGDLSKFRSFEK